MNQTSNPPKLEPAIIVIFGMSGDLSRRKLLPALYYLIKNNLLDDRTVILGVTRRDVTARTVLDQVETTLKQESSEEIDQVAWQKLRQKVGMMRMDIEDSREYKRLLNELNKIEADQGLCMNRLYYLSTPPEVIGSIITYLGENGLNQSCPHNVATTRLLVEKPFGRDYKTAYELIKIMSKQFTEDQIFRIDHYLAKETVQNILTFRFNNIFEEVWNNNHISHVIISAAETIGIEGRSVFYEQVGALRDFVQNHLIQLLSVTTLNLPKEISSDSLHSAKLALLDQITPVAADQVFDVSVRGQYEGYRKEVNNPESKVETFAALKLNIASARWEGVPFLLSSGKMLDQKNSEIRIVFKPMRSNSKSNSLVFRLQPEEGIELDLLVKKPGFDNELQATIMEFNYQNVFDNHGHPDAYERVLVDAVRGDRTLFSTSKEVLRAWNIVDPLLHAWSASDNQLEIYRPGSGGPKSITNFNK